MKIPRKLEDRGENVVLTKIEVKKKKSKKEEKALDRRNEKDRLKSKNG